MRPEAGVHPPCARDAGLGLAMARDNFRTLVESHTRDSASPEQPAAAIVGVVASLRQPRGQAFVRGDSSSDNCADADNGPDATNGPAPWLP